jgi:hypothetical protein
MTTYLEVAQALVRAGYVSGADVEAAASVLGDVLVVQAAQDAVTEALADTGWWWRWRLRTRTAGTSS